MDQHDDEQLAHEAPVAATTVAVTPAAARLRYADDGASADGSFALLADDAPLAAAAAIADPTATPPSSPAAPFAAYEPELLQWMQACQAADHGLPPSQDDVLAFLESKFPELLARAAALFAWLSRVLRAYNQAHAPSVLLEADAAGVQHFDRFSDDFKLSALQRLAATGDLGGVARDFGLKSAATLLFWKHERDAAGQALAARGQQQQQRKAGGFAHDQELLAWVLARRGSPITKHDVFAHVAATYPELAATRTPAALKMWISRFLKRHLSSPGAASATDVRTALPAAAAAGDGADGEGGAAEPSASPDSVALAAAAPTAPPAARTPAASPPPTASASAPALPKRRAKRGCPGGYVLHTNEFKLSALRKLDEGRSASEVAEELGLKSQNTLAYWSSIREKLATAEKKRFRLAGGGRRSSCPFEDELLSWVGDRHQRGEGTDVASVLGYLREAHPAFAEGKKEPTLRKWILRFFKRCWKTPTSAAGSASDAEKAISFV